MEHGYVAIIIEREQYIQFLHKGAKFEIPVHAGHFPDTVSSVEAIYDKQVVKHNALTVEYEVCAGVINTVKEKIVKSVGKE